MKLNMALIGELLVSESPLAASSLKGWFVKDGGRVAVLAKYASRFSMWAEFEGHPGNGTVVNLELELEGETVHIGACQVSHDSDTDSEIYRLIPNNIFFDLEKLFFKGKLVLFDPSLANLALVLEHKKGISPDFVKYVSDLSYDLNSYEVLLDQLDLQYAGEPTDVRNAIQAGILEREVQGFTCYMDNSNDELRQLASQLDEEEKGRYGYFFRRQLWNLILRSPLLSRTNLKPRGYNGDSEMMQMLYINDYQGDSTFGKLLHNYSVKQPAAQAVRNRRYDVSTMLRDRLRELGSSTGKKVRILSVACGPAFEIRDILQSNEDCEKIHVSLLDQDQEALAEAAAHISLVETRLGATVSVDYIKESVRTMLADKQLEKRLGRYDFIYSLGLFDYLSAVVAKAIVLNLYELLSPGGELVIGNLSASNPCRYFMEFWHDWKLIYRTKEDLLEMVPDSPGVVSKVRFDETGIQMMLCVKKPAVNV